MTVQRGLNAPQIRQRKHELAAVVRHAQRVSATDYTSGLNTCLGKAPVIVMNRLALGASAIAAPAFAETPRNAVTSYDKIPNQSGLQSKVIVPLLLWS